MKRLFFTLIALWMVGTASAQEVTPPAAAGLKTPVGVKNIPVSPSLDALAERPAQQATELQTLYAALATYEDALARQRPHAAKTPAHCAMILWADSVAAVPMPTLTPDPTVDPNMPIMAPNMGCVPPSDPLKLHPDALISPRPPLKKLPLKFRKP